MKPTAEQVRKGLDHVHYEISMLVCAGRVPEFLYTDNQDFAKAVGNLLLEARLVHARNLIEFFDHHRKRDSLNAMEEYGLKYEPLQIKPEIETRLHKEISHLSIRRVERTEETKGWSYDDLDRPLIERSTRFVEHLLMTRTSFGEKHPISNWETLLVVLKAQTDHQVLPSAATTIQKLTVLSYDGKKVDVSASLLPSRGRS